MCMFMLVQAIGQPVVVLLTTGQFGSQNHALKCDSWDLLSVRVFTISSDAGI